MPLVDYASDSSEEPAAPVPPAVVATPAPAPETAPPLPKAKAPSKPPPRPKVRRDREESRISSQRPMRPRSAVPRHRAHHRTRPRPRPHPRPYPTPHLRHLHLDLHRMTLKVVLHLHLDLYRMTTTVAHHHRTASSPRKMHRRHRKLCLYHRALES